MIEINRLHWVTDAPLSPAQGRALGERFTQALQHALPASTPALRIGELRVQLPRAALNEPAALTALAQQTARQLGATFKEQT